MNDSRLRSTLIVNACDASGCAEALACGADALLLVLGGEDRDAARARAREWLLEARRIRERPKLFARLRPAESRDMDADLAALAPALPDGFFLEDVRGRASVERLGARLAVVEAEQGLANGATRIFALAAQSAAGALMLGNCASWPRRLSGLVFDGTGPGPPGAATLAFARTQLALAAAAAGVLAVDGPSEAQGKALRAACLLARRDGYGAKLAVAARQIAAINAAFG